MSEMGMSVHFLSSGGGGKQMISFCVYFEFALISFACLEDWKWEMGGLHGDMAF